MKNRKLSYYLLLKTHPYVFKGPWGNITAPGNKNHSF